NFYSIDHYELKMTRAVFTSGRSPFEYMRAFNTDLFLSTDALDVRKTLEAGLASAMILPSKTQPIVQDELRIAFDGDSVIFSDESERIYQAHNLEVFNQNERDSAKNPLSGGPFK